MKLSEYQMNYLKDLFNQLRDLQVNVEMKPLYDIVHGIDISIIRSAAGKKGGRPKKNVGDQPVTKPPKQVEVKVKEEKIQYAELVYLTQKEYQALLSKYSPAIVDECIFKLNSYKQSSGKKYASDYGAINSWVLDKVLEKLGQSQRTFNAKPKPKPAAPKTYAAVEF